MIIDIERQSISSASSSSTSQEAIITIKTISSLESEVVTEISHVLKENNIFSVSFWLGVVRFIQFGAGITLLVLTGQVTSSGGSLSTNSDGTVNISGVTGSQLFSLMASIITASINIGINTWRNLPYYKGKDFGTELMMCVTEIVQLVLWCATSVWFTVRFGKSACNSSNSWRNSTASTVGSGDIVGSNTRLKYDLIDAVRSTESSLNASTSSLSVLSSTMKTASSVAEDCHRQRAGIGVCWLGVSLFILSTTLVLIMWKHKKRSLRR